MINPEQRPPPKRLSKTNLTVLSLARSGVTDPKIIAADSGITEKEIRKSLSVLRTGYGLLVQRTIEERLETKRPVLNWIEQYHLLGMSPIEIEVALKIKGGKKFSLSQIQTCILNARRTKALAPPTPEDRSDKIRDSKKMTPEERNRFVETWLFLINRFTQKGIQLPQGRFEWKKKIMEISPLKEFYQISGRDLPEEDLAQLGMLLTALTKLREGDKSLLADYVKNYGENQSQEFLGKQEGKKHSAKLGHRAYWHFHALAF